MTGGIDMGGQSKTLLTSYVKRVKAREDEIAEIRADVSEICKEARDAGFDSTQIREVVRWLIKLDKHGRAAMDEAEAIFDLYRSVVDGGAVKFDEMMTEARDRALLKIFAPDDQMDAGLNKRRKTARTAATLSRAAREAGNL